MRETTPQELVDKYYNLFDITLSTLDEVMAIIANNAEDIPFNIRKQIGEVGNRYFPRVKEFIDYDEKES